MARTTDPEKNKESDEEYAERLRALKELQRTLKAEFPGRSVGDELIAERRAIARAENADYSQRQDDDD